MPSATVLLYAQRTGEEPEAAGSGWLTADECRRAEGFRASRSRNEFIAGRRLARLALSEITGRDPAEHRFALDALGRPSAAAGAPGGECRFSIAHSHGLVICAACEVIPVGADLEPRSRAGAVLEIAERALTARERSALAKVPAPERGDRVLRRWVDKEAFAKLNGLGLTLGFERMAVDDDGPERVLYTGPGLAGGRTPVHRWHPDLDPTFLVCVVCEAPPGVRPALVLRHPPPGD